MKHQEEISLQTLTDNEDIQVGYSDNDIVIVDNIQKFAEISNAYVSMNAIVICTQGKVQGTLKSVDGQQFTITTKEKQKVEGKKRPVVVDVDKTYQMEGVKYAKYLLAFK